MTAAQGKVTIYILSRCLQFRFILKFVHVLQIFPFTPSSYLTPPYRIILPQSFTQLACTQSLKSCPFLLSHQTSFNPQFLALEFAHLSNWFLEPHPETLWKCSVVSDGFAKGILNTDCLTSSFREQPDGHFCEMNVWADNDFGVLLM